MPEELSTVVALVAGSLLTIMIGYIRHLVKERRRLVVENTRERQAHTKTRTRRDELAEEVLTERKQTLAVRKSLLEARSNYERSLHKLSIQWEERERTWTTEQLGLATRVQSLEQTDVLRKRKLEVLTEQYDAMYREKLQVEEDREQLKQKLETAEREIKSLRLQVDALKSAVEKKNKLEKTVGNLREEIDNLRQRLSAYDKKIETSDLEGKGKTDGTVT